MGFFGWVARRALAYVIFTPLVALWLGVFIFLLRLPPGFLGLRGQGQTEVLLAAVFLAIVSDFLIVRAVKRRMNRPKAAAAR